MKKLTILFILFLVLISSSCEKYLDIKKSNDQVLVSTANDCQLLLDDYGKMNYKYPSDGNLSSDEFFVKDEDLNAVMLSGRVKSEDFDLFTWKASAIRPLADPQWQEPYNKIYTANVILETVEKLRNDGDSDGSTLDGIKGAALFFRSFCFWQIAQLYASPYSSNAETEFGIPLRLEADVSKKSNRGSVEQTYDQIIKDLEEAAILLPRTSVVPTRPNKAAAYGMLARIYLSMENYSLALSNANAALEIKNSLIDYNTLDKESSTPFERYNAEMIFHAVTVSSVLVSSSISGQYARIDPYIVSSYANGDLRKEILLKPNISTDGALDGTYRFSGNYERHSSQMFSGIAVDEIYLIRAECYARQGNIEAAMVDLNMLLIKRWKPELFIPLTAQNTEQALDQILLERRKELLMRGLRWYDLRRLNKDGRYAITLTRLVNGTLYTLPANSLKYTLLIPQDVITYGNIQQNLR